VAASLRITTEPIWVESPTRDQRSRPAGTLECLLLDCDTFEPVWSTITPVKDGLWVGIRWTGQMGVTDASEPCTREKAEHVAVNGGAMWRDWRSDPPILADCPDHALGPRVTPGEINRATRAALRSY
jgi:hypothetical protein